MPLANKNFVRHANGQDINFVSITVRGGFLLIGRHRFNIKGALKISRAGWRLQVNNHLAALRNQFSLGNYLLHIKCRRVIDNYNISEATRCY